MLFEPEAKYDSKDRMPNIDKTVYEKRPRPPVGGHTFESNEFGDILYWQPGNPRPKNHWCFMPALEAWSGDCGHIIGEALSYPVCKSTQCITPYCPAALTVSKNIGTLRLSYL
jgi:hypothetical protein